jgi:hypothetical protein
MKKQKNSKEWQSILIVESGDFRVAVFYLSSSFLFAINYRVGADYVSVFDGSYLFVGNSLWYFFIAKVKKTTL